MSLARWHTPTPPPPPPAQPKPVATISRERLTVLMRQHHYLDKELNELEILAEYGEKFPARRTRDIYQMMAELMTDAEVAQVYKELAPASTKTTEPPPDYQHGSESARDHLGADNIIRHMHRNPPSPYNQGPPVGKDPYLGTGLNPAHVSGVVSPNDGLAPEMACCGQPLGSKGCWIRLMNGQPMGELTRYQTWFTTKEPAVLWQRIVQGGSANTLKNETVTGTAFIKEDYYRDLDRQIRRLIDELAPVVFQIFQTLLSNGFTQPANFGFIEDKLIELVALVQRYNAPQMGACHHERTIDARSVFFEQVGREEFRQGRLVTSVRIGNVNVPLVFPATAAAFTKTAAALNVLSNASDFKRAAQLLTDGERIQSLVQAQRSNAESIIAGIDQGFLRVSLPNVLAGEHRTALGLYEAAQRLADELKNMLTALPGVANQWLLNYPNESIAGFQQATVQAKAKLDQIKPPNADALKMDLSIFNVNEAEIDGLISSDTLFSTLGESPEIRKWARAAAANIKWTAMYGENDELTRTVEGWRSMAEKAKKTQEEEARETAPLPPPPLFLSPDRRNVSLQREQTLSSPIVLPSGSLVNRPNFKYQSLSCAYDTLFTALFMIPDQWFRNVIVSAKTVRAYSTCPEKEAREVDGQIIQVIQKLEGTRDSKQPVICPTIQWWQNCMRTRPPGEEASRVDDPGPMLDALAAFYGVSESINTFVVYQNFPVAVIDDLPQTEMRIFRTTSVSTGTDFSDIPLVMGDFTIIACIVRGETYLHWQVCVRDPRERTWYRFKDDGRPFRLSGDQPVDIRTQSFEPEKNVNVPYRPVYWFYVKTSRLEPFLAKTNDIAKSVYDYYVKERGKIPKSDTLQSIMTLFSNVEDYNTIQRRPDYPSPRKFTEDDVKDSILTEYGVLGFIADLFLEIISIDGNPIGQNPEARNIMAPVLERLGMLKKVTDSMGQEAYDWTVIETPKMDELEKNSPFTAKNKLILLTKFVSLIFSEETVAKSTFIYYYTALLN